MGWFDTFKRDFRVDYTARILGRSIEASNAIRRMVEEEGLEQERQPLKDSEWFLIMFEFVYFYLHLTDRYAFGRMDEKRRGELMTGLEDLLIRNAVDTVLPKGPEDENEMVREMCLQTFRSRVEEYSKYKKLHAEKDEGLKNTLFWEFGKVIAKLAGGEGKASYIMPIVGIAIGSLEHLDIPSFVEKAK